MTRPRPTVPDHPAPYSAGFMAIAAEMLAAHGRTGGIVLDPFAGIGGVFRLHDYLPRLTIHAIEIQPAWAAADPRIRVGDALKLPYPDAAVDALVTSPTYGSRLADTFSDRQPAKNYVRTTYTHCHGAPLHPHNSGRLQWGPGYRWFHLRAWLEARRVLRPRGLFVLNLKDHIRNGVRQPVTAWHVHTLQDLGFELLEWCDTPARGQRQGRNREARVPYESLILLQLAAEAGR